MLDLIAAMWMQEVEPPEVGSSVRCDVMAETNSRGQITGLSMDCPDDVHQADQLQAYADERVSQVRLRFRDGVKRPVSRVRFHWSGEIWQLNRIRQIMMSAPSLPLRAMTSGVALDALCVGVLSVSDDGRTSDQDWTCRVSIPEHQNRTERQFIRASEDAARNARWLLPSDVSTGCVELEFLFQLHPGPSDDEIEAMFPAAEHPKCPELE